MADSTLKKLMQLISSNEPVELRRAAVLVAGVVGQARDRSLIKTLLPVLQDADPELRVSAIEALARLHAEEALPQLAVLVRQGGLEVEAAARAAGQLGARGVKLMGQVMAEAAPALKRRVAAALALSGTDSAAVATAQALLDEDPGVVEAAARSLAGEVPALSAGQRKALAGHLIQTLQERRRPPLRGASEAALVRVLSALHDSRAEEVYWDRLDPARPPALRAAALHALGTLPPPTTDARIQRLLACAAAADFQIVAPALLLLQHVPAGRKNVKYWLRLLEAPDVAARRFAVDKLRDVPTPEAARALVAQIRHPDRALREAALAALRESPSGRLALFEELLAAPTAEEAWSLARFQDAAAAAMAAAERTQLFERACRYQDQDDRRAEPLWFLLREGDAADTRDRIEANALALRKKKDYAGALAYFRLLTRDPACAEDIRFETAATGLKVSGHDTAAAARHNDLALGQFARLLQNPAFDVFGRIAKAKWLDAQDLFYLGFHFAEQTHQAREFGHQVLELVVKRSPRSELAKNARRKLKSEGLV
jgi:HEAT repeat protein